MNDFSQAPQFDTGPLSWVMGEIRDALGRSQTVLLEALAQTDDARTASLQLAKTHLHQAHGALQMVDVEGVGAMTSAAEQVLSSLKEGTLECNAASVAAVTDAYLAVIEYLDELLSGNAPQPSRLFPYYRALRELLGAERIHPADLFFADLSIPVSLPASTAPAGEPDYAACRARFEKALLPFLKSVDEASRRAAARAMQEAIALVADAQHENHARTFWLAMQGFAELVATGQMGNNLYVKQLFGLINLQIRRLSQGQGSLPEAMLRDALFFIAAAASPPPIAQSLRKAYRLDGMVPFDYDVRRYGRIDPEALKSAREALAQAKTSWGTIAAEPDAAVQAQFEQSLAALGTASAKLGSPALVRLLECLVRAAHEAALARRAGMFGLEMASAMLFVEHGLDRIRQLPADFDTHADMMGKRMLALAVGQTPPDAPQWQGDLSRQTQQSQTVAALAGEMKTGLRQVEKVLDEYYGDTSKRATLAQIDPVLHQLQGALAILDQDDAMRAAQHVKAAVHALAAAEGEPAKDAASLQNIAQNIGALGFFIDMLAQNFEAAKDRFAFDPAQGMFRSVQFEKPVVGETPFDQTDIGTRGAQPAPAPVAAVEAPPAEKAAEPAAQAHGAAPEAADAAPAEAPELAFEPVSAPAAPAATGAPAATFYSAPPLASVVSEGDSEIEAELLEIFISEAEEVLQFVAATLPAAYANPNSQETLTMLRRSFHTLKGSGRMVGLDRFADAGAAIERVMNVWLSEIKPANANLFALLERATTDMSAWVAELMATGSSRRSPDALVKAAALVQNGDDFLMEDEAAVEAAPEAAQAAVQEAAPEPEIVAEAVAEEAVPEPALAPTPELVPELTFEAAPEAPLDMMLPDAAFDLELPSDIAPPEPIEMLAPVQEFDLSLPEFAIELAPPIEAAPAPSDMMLLDEPFDMALLEEPIELAAPPAADEQPVETGVPVEETIELGLLDEAPFELDLQDEAPIEMSLPFDSDDEPLEPLEALDLSVSSSEPTFDLSVSEPASDLSASEPSFDLSLPEPALDLSAPEPTFDLSVPEPALDLSVPEPTFDLSAPEPTFDLSVPEETFDLTLPEAELELTPEQAPFEMMPAEAAFDMASPTEPEAPQQPSGFDLLANELPLDLELPEASVSSAAPPQVAAPAAAEPAEAQPAQADDSDAAAEAAQAASIAEAEKELQEERGANGDIDPNALEQEEREREIAADLKQAADDQAGIAAGSGFMVAEPEAEAAPVREASAKVIEFLAGTQPAVSTDDSMKRIGEIEIPLPLFHIYLAETDELMRVLERDFSEWRHEPLRAATPEAIKAAHTLTGTSATVGFKALREVAYALEMALKVLSPPSPVLDDAQRDLLDTARVNALEMLQRFANGDLAEARPALVAELQQLREQLASQVTGAVYGDSDHAVLDEAIAAIVPEPEQLVPELIDQAEPAGLVADLVEPAGELVPELISQAEPEVPAHSHWPLAEPESEPEAALAAGAAEAAAEAAAVVAATAAASAAATGPESVALSTVYSDDLDADLLPVFIEEATDLLPELGNLLRKWQQAPVDKTPVQSLLRNLHTIKGSARMAGAMRLGQHAHEIETQIENMVHAGTTLPAAFDDLLANYDHALLLFEQLQHPGSAAPAEDADGAAVPGQAPKTIEDAVAAQARTPLVRVRADILDRLVNQAGEVSITRSKLETQVATLKTSLLDFSENLARLRRQLREVEMQAESQISSRMSISNEREFDPLEFDRFTRLQELTRMMAESVNDVGSFHESLGRTVDIATDDLTIQSRLTRDLQRDLMRVRMVPFSSLSERLFRVARQSAKELDKRVNLDIRGGTVEIDRSVLEQMAGPFEHLLRNSIVHGIESREKRGLGGKAETGELLVQVSQQGNEVVIAFTDDGAGLDLNRIREKAREKGLLEAGAEVTDAQAADLIFEPGFSTADALSELAGRGVGMDVVRSEAQALGGRVDIATEFGKGARFTIRLPLTLSVTQVVLTTSGSKTYAMPSILVEQVLQMKEAAVNAAHAAGFVSFQGEEVALHFLPTLLGDTESRPIAQRSSPVLILKSGTDRLAVQVDDVPGNREVVIKNIGQQLSRMVGISGATVLGSGEIVLILNPVGLSQHIAQHQPRKAAPAIDAAHDGAPASDAAEVPAGVADAPAAPVVAAPQKKRIRDTVVMVVDDSLTVRRVTQRLLEREGYQVMLAKDGVDALEHLQESTPDLMLVDIEMPRMDGFDLTRNIRDNPKTREVPIIMITSRTADKHRNYAIGLGVNAYFGKPFQEDVLLAAIAGLLGNEVPVHVEN
ncbi:MAG: Hpt domain-containing protein [Pseudomonadota bacterium]